VAVLDRVATVERLESELTRLQGRKAG
jgi:hypothetical protein